MKKHPTSNIQHPISSVQYRCSERHSREVNNIGNWMLTNFGFTPCKAPTWLLEPMTDAAKFAAQEAVILLSPARSSIDGFQKRPGNAVKSFISERNQLVGVSTVQAPT